MLSPPRPRVFLNTKNNRSVLVITVAEESHMYRTTNVILMIGQSFRRRRAASII